MTDCYEVETPYTAIESGQRPARQRPPRVMAKSGWHKARRIILTENAEAVIERKLGWIK